VSTLAPAAPQLAFDVDSVEAAEHAAVPTLCFGLRIDAGDSEIRSVALNVQLRIDAARRAYDDAERVGLFELFGASRDWGRSLRGLRWTTASLNVPGFAGATTVELAVPCTYDFDVVATKYLHALSGGEVPLVLLFSGTVFTRGETGFAVEQLSWSLEARCRLPVASWRDLMDLYFPGAGWIRLDRDTIDALARYRSAHGLTSWEQTLATLLPAEVSTP